MTNFNKQKTLIMKPFAKIASILLFIVGILHLTRVLLNMQIVVGSIEIPMWVSIVGFIIPILLGVGLWRESKIDKL